MRCDCLMSAVGMVRRWLVILVLLSSACAWADDPVPGTTASSPLEYKLVPLYYFSDATQVLQLLREDAAALDETGYAAAKAAAEEARTAARTAEIDQRQAEEELRIATERLAAARGELAEAQQAVKQAESDVYGWQSQEDRLAITETRLQGQIDVIDARLSATPAPSPEETARLKQEKSQLSQEKKSVAQQRGMAARERAAAEVRKSRAESMLAGAEGGAETARGLVRGAQATYDAKRTGAATKQKAAILAVAAQWDAEVALSQTQRRFVARAHTGPVTDPLMKLEMQTVSPSVLLLRGTGEDIDAALKAIDQLDRPMGQARVTIWTLQVNGQGGERGLEALEKVVTGIEEELSLARNEITACVTLLQQCIQRQAWAVAAANPNVEPEPRFAFFAEKVREALPELTEQLQDGIKRSRLDPLSVNTLGEAILVLVLASEESRQKVLDDFLTPAAEREARLQEGAGRCAAQPAVAGNDPVQFRQVRMMLGEELVGGDRLTAQQLEMIRAIKTTLQGKYFAYLYDTIAAVEAELQPVEEALGMFDTEHRDWFKYEEMKAMRLSLMTRRTDLTTELTQLRDSAGRLGGIYRLLGPGMGKMTASSDRSASGYRCCITSSKRGAFREMATT